ncbi:MAG: glycosyl hydrolase family 38 [Lewinellaceae bacterium]|nr:glycosyl hydrolase family 38 [Lewinellaceae bacterium]
MTFRAGLSPGLVITPFPAVIKGETNQRAVAVTVYHFQRPTEGRLYANGKFLQAVPLKFGHNYLSLGWPANGASDEVHFRLDAAGYAEEKTIKLEPFRHWQVDFVQHSHTDIGYTRPQTEILAEHLRYIDYALDYCDATDNYPDDAKFRWTCEAAWAVDEYLRSRPKEQVERLKRRVREGRIEVTAMYFNFDELPDEQTLASSLAANKRFREAGLKVQLAMQNDVNGTGWCFNDFFNSIGVKYLNMGTHGHRALICFDIPTAFWWESPSGNRMLAFRAEHYMTGNTAFGIHGQDFPYFEEKLMAYLLNLGDKGYPHDVIAIQHSGYLTDNSPPSTRSSEMIRMWNEKYEWPRLRSAAASEFFEYLEENHAAGLPIYRVAWPDWWTDGFGSAAREVAATRDAEVDMIANQGALSMGQMLGGQLPRGITGRIEEANKAILFYGEHTLGSSESVRDPYGTATMEQREMKESFAWEANRRAKMIGEEAMGILQHFFSKAAQPRLLVFNTLGWPRDGLLTVYIDHQLLPLNREFRILDEAGHEAPAQQLGSRSDGTYWAVWVEQVPAFGVKKYHIELGAEMAGPAPAEQTSEPPVLENQWYRMVFSSERGAVTSLYDKELALELVDPGAPWKLGEFINERLGNRSQLEGRKLNDYQRFGLDTIWYDSFERGPIWNTVRFKGESSTFFSPNGYDITFRLFNTTKRVGLAYEVVKRPVIEPEGIYLAFPFQLEGGKIYCEVPGGLMDAGKGQLPGSANDWNTIQNFVAVRNAKAQLAFGSHEVPLAQFGAINTGRFIAGATPDSTHIFSWPMNNYWTTNFNADQRGGHEWSYYLTSSDDTSNSFATRFGWGARVPFPTRVLPPGEGGEDAFQGSLLRGVPANILLVNAMPEEGRNSVVLQLRELDGKVTPLSLQGQSGRPLRLDRVDVLGSPLQGGTELKPFENAFFRLSWD